MDVARGCRPGRGGVDGTEAGHVDTMRCACEREAVHLHTFTASCPHAPPRGPHAPSGVHTVTASCPHAPPRLHIHYPLPRILLHPSRVHMHSAIPHAPPRSTMNRLVVTMHRLVSTYAPPRVHTLTVSCTGTHSCQHAPAGGDAFTASSTCNTCRHQAVHVDTRR